MLDIALFLLTHVMLTASYLSKDVFNVVVQNVVIINSTFPKQMLVILPAFLRSWVMLHYLSGEYQQGAHREK